MTSEPIHLTLLREGELIAIDLEAADPIVPRSRVQVSESLLREICEEVAHLATVANRETGAAWAPPSTGSLYGTSLLDQLKAVGRIIFSHLFSEATRHVLSRTPTTDLFLRLDDQLVHIPWELAFDGQDFLLTKFRIARQVLTQAPSIRPLDVGTRSEAPLRMLIILDPTETLSGAEEEAHELCILLDQYDAVDVSLLGGKRLKKLDLLKGLSEADLVHYAGHAAFDPVNAANSGWLLHDGVLTASEISRLERPPLLVFSNACQAGATAQWAEQYRFEGETFGLGSGFLLAGVRHYLGALWVIHDGRSAGFAAAFYRQLLQGQTIGEALLQARHQAIKAYGWEELLWAGYLHYGNPTFRLLALGSPAAEPQVEDPSQGRRGLALERVPSVSDPQAEAEIAQSPVFNPQPSSLRRWTVMLWALSALVLGGGLAALLSVAPPRMPGLDRPEAERLPNMKSQ